MNTLPLTTPELAAISALKAEVLRQPAGRWIPTESLEAQRRSADRALYHVNALIAAYSQMAMGQWEQDEGAAA